MWHLQFQNFLGGYSPGLPRREGREGWSGRLAGSAHIGFGPVTTPLMAVVHRQKLQDSDQIFKNLNVTF